MFNKPDKNFSSKHTHIFSVYFFNNSLKQKNINLLNVHSVNGTAPFHKSSGSRNPASANRSPAAPAYRTRKINHSVLVKTRSKYTASVFWAKRTDQHQLALVCWSCTAANFAGLPTCVAEEYVHCIISGNNVISHVQSEYI